MKAKKRLELAGALVILAVLIIIGTWFFYHEEGWSWVNSFYFTVMTVTTVGYGDLVPTHDLSKIITAFYSMISIPLVIFALGTIAKRYFEDRILGVEKRISLLLNREENLEKDVEEVIEDEKKLTN